MTRIIPLALACLLVLPALADGPPSLTVEESDQIAERIYQNECAGLERNLTHWNEGEDFPSLGIGHFIWYPAGVAAPFEESFPALIAFYRARGVPVLPWLNELQPFAAPWLDRAQFYQRFDEPEMRLLRRWLADTRAVQAEFMAERLRQTLPGMLAAVETGQRTDIRRKLDTLLATPGGRYPLIDYLNFKGDGTVTTERYRNQGWGLLQVLAEMRQGEQGADALNAFADASATVLRRRVENSPPERNEQRWLPGWLKRVESYRQEGEGQAAAAAEGR